MKVFVQRDNELESVISNNWTFSWWNTDSLVLRWIFCRAQRLWWQPIGGCTPALVTNLDRSLELGLMNSQSFGWKIPWSNYGSKESSTEIFFGCTRIRSTIKFYEADSDPETSLIHIQICALLQFVSLLKIGFAVIYLITSSPLQSSKLSAFNVVTFAMSMRAVSWVLQRTHFLEIADFWKP